MSSRSKRRIEQIKAKLTQMDKSISNSMKQNSVSLVDLIDNKSRNPQTNSMITQSQKTIDKSRCVHLDLTDNRFYKEAKIKNFLL